MNIEHRIIARRAEVILSVLSAIITSPTVTSANKSAIANEVIIINPNSIFAMTSNLTEVSVVSNADMFGFS